MRMKRFARVFTSAMLAGAMMMTMGGMTAFAAESAIPDNQLPLTKVLVADENTYAPNTNFEFVLRAFEELPGATIDPGNGFGGVLESDGTTVSTTQKLPVRSGIEGGLSISGTVAFASTDERVQEQNGYVNTSAHIAINPSVFEEVGIYHYQIEEKTPDKLDDLHVDAYEGIVYDKDIRDLYVYVTLIDGKVTVSNIVVSIGGKKVGIDETVTNKYKDPVTGEEVATGVVFTNYYGDKNDNDKDLVYDLKVKKIVTGNQGNKSTDFDFTIQVDGNATDEDYKVIKYNESDVAVPFPKTDKDGNPIAGVNEDGSIRLDSGLPKTVPLKSGEYFKVYGLTSKDRYTVIEDDANDDSYTTTYDIDKDDKTTEGSTSYIGAITGNVTKTNVQTYAGGVVNVYNRREVTTPTGIVLSFAPYIMLVALAGVFAVLFLRKKKEEF